MKEPKRDLRVDSKVHDLFKLYDRLCAKYSIGSLSKVTKHVEQSTMMRKYAHYGLVDLLDEEARAYGTITDLNKRATSIGEKLLRFLDQEHTLTSRRLVRTFQKVWQRLELELLALGVIKFYLKQAKHVARKSENRLLPALMPNQGVHSAISPDVSLMEENNKDADLRAAYQVIRNLRESKHALERKMREGRDPTKESLLSLVDKCRKKNGSINVLNVGKELGVSNHTADKWLRRYGIK